MTLKEKLQRASNAPKPRETVPTPELAEFDIPEIIIQGMGGQARDGWEKSLIVGRGKRREVNTENVRAKLVTLCAINPDGSLAMDESDAVWLGQMRVDVLNRLFEVSQRLSGVRDQDIDELGKPSAPTAGSDSPSN